MFFSLCFPSSTFHSSTEPFWWSWHYRSKSPLWAAGYYGQHSSSLMNCLSDMVVLYCFQMIIILYSGEYLGPVSPLPFTVLYLQCSSLCLQIDLCSIEQYQRERLLQLMFHMCIRTSLWLQAAYHLLLLPCPISLHDLRPTEEQLQRNWSQIYRHSSNK